MAHVMGQWEQMPDYYGVNSEDAMQRIHQATTINYMNALGDPSRPLFGGINWAETDIRNTTNKTGAVLRVEAYLAPHLLLQLDKADKTKIR
eukprot:335360_1